jgi:PPOX class probable F420-dependent enzyme
MTLDEARARFEAARVARLATVRSDGAPHAVPIVFALDGDRLAFAVDDKPKRTRELRRLENIEFEPRVSILVDHYEEPWSHLWWVRADGLAAIARGEAVIGRAIDLLAAKYEPYRRRRPPGPVVVVDIDTWRFWPED